jgi:hypothetical protein
MKFYYRTGKTAMETYDPMKASFGDETLSDQ